jgi:crossover junction endodeoxyribonuclease RuvC
MVIMGLDPGTVVMGYGIIEIKNKKITLLSMGAIQLDKYDNQQMKLVTIFQKVTRLLESYKPDICAVEAPFYGKNVQSMLKLGRAQGVCMVAALNRDIPVVEYSPKKIKQSITGSGSASKEQVAAMLKSIVKIEEAPKFLDATDGLAAAVCHHFQSSGAGIAASGSSGGWKDFIKKNPGRIKK